MVILDLLPSSSPFISTYWRRPIWIGLPVILSSQSQLTFYRCCWPCIVHTLRTTPVSVQCYRPSSHPWSFSGCKIKSTFLISTKHQLRLKYTVEYPAKISTLTRTTSLTISSSQYSPFSVLLSDRSAWPPQLEVVTLHALLAYRDMNVLFMLLKLSEINLKNIFYLVILSKHLKNQQMRFIYTKFRLHAYILHCLDLHKPNVSVTFNHSQHFNVWTLKIVRLITRTYVKRIWSKLI
jgi:hypothetical protein